MGDYNPHRPRIIGQEWVPIRDEDVVFSPAVNAVEIGHGFALDTSRVLQDARFYINDFPAGPAVGQVYLAAVYPEGSENLSGPIKSVVIPCVNGGVTGALLLNASTVAEAMADPSDQRAVIFGAAGTNTMSLFFATNSYAALLNGKRILAVNLLYSAAGNFAEIRGLSRQLSLTIANNAGATAIFGALEGASVPALEVPPIERARFGEINHFWDTSLSPTSTPDRMPWRYADLQRLEASAANRIFVRVRSIDTAGLTFVQVEYAALEVIFCEEVRTALGARAFGEMVSFPNATSRYVLGTNTIPMRTTNNVINPTLVSGHYTLVISSADIGDYNATSTAAGGAAIQGTAGSQYPDLNGIRELYQIPSHPGVQVNVPYRAEDHVGDVFTADETHILPQLSLHTSGGPLTEVHVYGRQAIAQVYGTITATQEIEDYLAGGSASWPWVRYMARRFGNTTVPLTMTGAGQTVSITPAEFDALDEVIDGWKEITLRFSTPPTMGAGTIPQFVWSATGEAAGNRWEVLGATAPALSGIPGNLLNKVPRPNQLSVATYGQPVSGAQINLGWIPQYSPYVSATVDDDTSDAFIIFAQDMPTVTGFEVETLNQAISGIGQDCGLNPCCIPTELAYNQLTWSPTSSSIPTSGFGYYELQRMDTVETDWQTIMQSTSPTGAVFNDYEARVGILSTYRIRAVDVYEFPGLWSNEVTATIPEPGVTIGCEGGHLLIFTSNERQDGSINLAYSSVWESGTVEETFAFPEASFVQLQAMYGRDYFTAFRPTERGGEQFERTVLVQAAAIAPETLGDFTSLRDMAWAHTSYICVRDEDGNRWLATVVVPGGKVLRDRRLYLAPVTIIEVTDTPSPVDP